MCNSFWMHQQLIGIPVLYRLERPSSALPSSKSIWFARIRSLNLCGRLWKKLFLPYGKFLNFLHPFKKDYYAYIRRNCATALRIWKPLTEQGHVDVQFNMGFLYHKRYGVPNNLRRLRSVAGFRPYTDIWSLRVGY